jgi:hypothetical protein
MTIKAPVLRFDPQRRAADVTLRHGIGKLIDFLQSEEQRLKLRSRERRDADRRGFRLAAEALTCNLLIAAMVPPGAPLSVPRSHSAMWGRGRYRNPVYGQHFLSLIDLLCEVGLAEEITRGFRFTQTARQATTIQPTEKLRARFPVADLKLNFFRQEDEPELLILKPVKDRDGRAEPIEYTDTGRTTKWRREIARLNAWLREAPITITEPATVMLDREGQPIEPYRRSVRRIFNNADWQQGGRIFGSYWMAMERDARFRFLRIAGEPIVNVDFSSLFPRLAYVRAGAAQPEADLYDVTGDGSCREGWKHLINALLFADRPLKQWPRDTRELFPEGASLREAVAAIKARHSVISHLFGRGLGFQLMRIESDMLIFAVTALFKRGVTALPLHDSILTAQSQAETARHVMEAIFREHTGASRAFVKLDFGPN